ncbi:MAG: PEP-CTERM sorting domain-containing protein [Phycisphaerae bacterium]|nr:PEP-CTERM sorting domain-containing protein [Phycisphaerae bacterium]
MMGRKLWMMGVVGLILTSTCAADTITFDETEMARLISGSVDSNVWYKTTPLGTNNGEDACLLGGYNWKTTAVMRFTDLGELSLGAGQSVVVNSASLKLYIANYSGSASALAVDVFEMLRGDWVYNESSWKWVNNTGWWSSNSAEWGAHYPSSSAAPVASLPLYGNYQTLASVSLPTDMIEAWINDGDNYGVRLASNRETTAGTDRMYIAAGNAGEYGSYGVTAAYRPQLEIDYTIIPEPTTLSLIGCGALLTLLRKKNRK